MRQQRLSFLATWVLAGVATFTCAAGFAAAEDDAAAVTLYRERCANCHDGGAVRAPDRTSMKLLAPDRVRAALTTGSMVEQARGLAPANSICWWPTSAAPLRRPSPRQPHRSARLRLLR